MPICEHCGSENLMKRGITGNKQRVVCKDCGKWGTYPVNETEDSSPNNYTFTNFGSQATVSADVTDEIRTEQDIIAALHIDTTVWRLERFEVKKSTAWRKDRKVDWEVSDGKVLHGSVQDSGEFKLLPVFGVKAYLVRKTEEIRGTLAIDDFRMNLNQFAVRIPKLQYPEPLPRGMLFEVEMPDFHLGKLTWGEETGQDTDIKIQVDQAKRVMGELLSYADKFPIERILFPIGHDFYNVDNQFNTTAHGTPQQEDTRWRKTFQTGWMLAADLINMCAEIAPVDVVIIPGNHDEERSYYLGEVLGAIYRNSDRVTIDNSPKTRKYYVYGNVLLGLTHGYHEKLNKLKDILWVEARGMLDKAKYIEWHTGDKHHKEDHVLKTNETENGVVIRILRSLTPPDAWHFNKGYIGALQAAEAFLWDSERGLKGQFTAIP